jgi:hypothetical protein
MPSSLTGLAVPSILPHTEIAVKIKIDANKKVKRVARAVIGKVPAAQVILPKADRKKPKHKTKPELEE